MPDDGFEKWWRDVSELSTYSITGKEFQEATERHKNKLALDEKQQVTLVSADGKYRTVVDRTFTGIIEDDLLKKWISSINQNALPPIADVQMAKTADPKLAALQKDISARHAAEAFTLTRQQDGALQRSGFQDDTVQNHLRARAWQNEKFTRERERYLAEYAAAQKLADQLKERDRQRGFEPEKGRNR